MARATLELEEVRPGRKLWVRRTQSCLPESKRRLAFLLVHGACAHSEQWDSQKDALQKAGASIVLFDALGCGHSDKPTGWAAYSPHELYSDLVAILEVTRKKFEKVILVGHSFGATLSLKLAAEKSDDLAGLALLSAFIPPEPGLTNSFLAAAFSTASWRDQPALIEQERRKSNSNPPYMFKAFHRQMGSFATHAECTKWAAAVQQPVLVMYGEADAITPLFPHSSHLLRHLSAAELVVVPDASHQVMQEKPEKVNAALKDLLERAL